MEAILEAIDNADKVTVDGKRVSRVKASNLLYNAKLASYTYAISKNHMHFLSK